MPDYHINIRHVNGILALNSGHEPHMIQSIGEKQSERWRKINREIYNEGWNVYGIS